MSLTPLETIVVGNDKTGHLMAYSILMFNAGLVFFKPTKHFIGAIVFCLIYGALIEVIQHYTPGRFMSGYDMVANASGVGVGAVLTYFLYNPIIRILQSTRII
jgi:VanZ family protein